MNYKTLLTWFAVGFGSGLSPRFPGTSGSLMAGIFFYFLISIILVFDKVSQLDLILAWIFVVSRYLHCYIRLSSNYLPYRAIVFQLGMLVLIAWWIIFLYNIL